MSFEELIKKYEPSMAVPMYPKALVIDFMEKAYEAGLNADVHTDNSAVIAELKAQIEKMRNCGNCDFFDFIFRDGTCYYDKECKNKDHWKLRR